MPEQLLTIQELAELLGVPVATVYRWRTHGDGPRGIRVGKHIRYRPRDVERYLDEHTDPQEAA